MSVISIIEPSKGGKVTYLVASTLIVIVLTILIFSITGNSLEQTVVDGQVQIPLVEIGPYLVPFASIGAIILWGIEPEKHIVEWWMMMKILGNADTSKTRVNMTSVLIFLRPWETSPIMETNLKTNLKEEYSRSIRGPEFEDQISELHNVFWLILLTPVSFYVMALFIPLMWILWWTGFVIGCLISYPFLKRNEKLVPRIQNYTFTRWVHESVSKDNKRRNIESFQLHETIKPIMANILGITSSVIDLVIRKDWKGFDRNSKIAEGLIPIPIPQHLDWNFIWKYLQLLIWSVREAEGNRWTSADQYLRNAYVQIYDAIIVYKEERESALSSDEEMIAETVLNLVSRIEDLQSLLDFTAEFYESFDEQSIRKITDGAHTILSTLPFELNKKKIPSIGGITSNWEQTSYFLVKAGEDELLDLHVVLKIVSMWKIDSTIVAKAIGMRGIRLLIEEDVGYTLEELMTISSTLRELVYQHRDKFDLNKVHQRLETLSQVYGDSLTVDYALRILKMRIPDPPQKPRHVFDVIQSFVRSRENAL